VIPLPFGLNAATIQLVALVAGFAVASVGGWVVRGWKEDAARLDAERDAHLIYVNTVDGWAAAMQEIGTQRVTDHQQAADDRRTFERRLKDATRPRSEPLVVCGPGLDTDGMVAAGGPVRFAPAFVGLWNDGLDIGLPAALRSGGSDRAGAPADPPRRD